MGHSSTGVLVRAVGAVSALGAVLTGAAPLPAAAPHPTGFALVELFTSEGCSSCPPADALLSQLSQEARNEGRRVYGLEFHVDYWDGLGWQDPFSDVRWTQRQRAYAAAASGGLYTPQMVVNGADGFVGSRQAEAQRRVQEALARPARADVGIRLAPASPAGALSVELDVRDAPDGAILHVALVQSGLVTRVTRGENAGRTLRHENVVRALSSVPLQIGRARQQRTEHATVTLQTRTVSQVDHARVVAWVQVGSAGAVVGASAADVPAPAITATR